MKGAHQEGSPRHLAPKYGNEKTVVGGTRFDSRREASRWFGLHLMERAGKINDLRRQVEFELIPVQKDKDGKVLERKCSYIADFVYRDENGNTVVEDSKGFHTKDYIIKRKLMLEKYGIRVKEV